MLIQLAIQRLKLTGVHTICPMDFLLARNLSALSRAQENVDQSLRHIEATIDCLNRDINVPAACSEATEQLLSSARALLLQVQQLLEAQSNEGAHHLREAQLNFMSQRAARPSSSTSSSASHAASVAPRPSEDPSGTTRRDTSSDGHSYTQTVVRGRVWRDDD